MKETSDKQCSICKRQQIKAVIYTDEECKPICYECYQKQYKIENLIIPSFPQPSIQMIIQHIYIGNEDAAYDKYTIDKYNIRAISVCGRDLHMPFYNKKMVGKFEYINYIKFDIDDYQDQKISHFFDISSNWIQQQLRQNRNILIHCSQGVSRSVSFLIAFLMSKRKMIFNDAYDIIRSQRKMAKPNPGFKKQLLEYQKSINNTLQK